MRVFVTGGICHSGSYVVPELNAAGHEVTGLARSDTAAAALSALGAKVRRGDLEDLDGLQEAPVIHSRTARTCWHPAGWTPCPPRSSRSCARTARRWREPESRWSAGSIDSPPLGAAGSIGSPGQLSRPVTEKDPALPVGDMHQGTLWARKVVETAVIDLAERGVRLSVVRIANIAHSTTDRAGFPLP